MISKIDFLFFAPLLKTEQCLDSLDSGHCVRVLRKKSSDKIFVTDGMGGIFRCNITDANPKKCLVEIIEDLSPPKSDHRKVNLFVCPTKSADRMEYLVEKSVEIGISKIQFLLSTNTYPKKVNVERMQKIAVSAMKQSLKAELPEIPEALKLKTFFNSQLLSGQKLIAHLDGKALGLKKLQLEEEVNILIGPEGDFTNEEINLANQNGFQTVTLGEERLRTETAAIVAVTLLNFL